MTDKTTTSNTSRDARCFVLEPPRKSMDFRALTRYGHVCYLINREVDRPPLFSPEFQHELVAELQRREYDPVLDFIVIAGSQVATTLFVVSALAASEVEGVKLLAFDARYSSYATVHVDLRSLRSVHQVGTD